MADYQRLAVAADIEICFCDPRFPWQPGSNENTNRLLRQYLPRGTDRKSAFEDFSFTARENAACKQQATTRQAIPDGHENNHQCGSASDAIGARVVIGPSTMGRVKKGGTTSRKIEPVSFSPRENRVLATRVLASQTDDTPMTETSDASPPFQTIHCGNSTSRSINNHATDIKAFVA